MIFCLHAFKLHRNIIIGFGDHMKNFYHFPLHLVCALLVLVLSAQLAFADPELELSESDLAGEWYSSKADTVIKIDADGTWHISDWDQSGWWALDSNKFIWMYEKIKVEDAEDINQIASYTKNEFTLLELDGSKTVFSRKE